jgi:hypothetical protein
MPGTTFVVQYYPVRMKLTDIVLIIAAMAAVTLAISRLTVNTMIRREATETIKQ